MIRIFKSESDLAFALYSIDSGEFMYGELCSSERLRQILNSFPKHEIELYIEKGPDEELQEFFYMFPHLQDLARVFKQRKINVEAMLSNAAHSNKSKRSFTLVKLCLGIIIGACILIPTSTEYKSSVLSQAKAIERLTTEFVENQPNWDSASMLYSSIESLYKEVRIESIKYSTRTYTIVFSSAKNNLAVEDLPNFTSATLTKVSSQKSKEGDVVYIYELEGEL